MTLQKTHRLPVMQGIPVKECPSSGLQRAVLPSIDQLTAEMLKLFVSASRMVVDQEKAASPEAELQDLSIRDFAAEAR